MHLGKIQEIFERWLAVLGDSGIDARHSSAFDPKLEGIALVTVMNAVRLDPERRACITGRQKSGNRPLARVHYTLAMDGLSDLRQAERALVSVLMEADQHPDIQLCSEAVPASWWLAHGVKPRPGFQFEVCISEHVQVSQAPLVQQVTVDMQNVRTIQGQVIWSGGQAVSRAQLRLPVAGQSVYTDRRGYFQLGLSGPLEQKEVIHVQVSEHAQTFSASDVAMEDGTWLLRMKEPR